MCDVVMDDEVMGDAVMNDGVMNDGGQMTIALAETGTNKRVGELDALRGLAALAVVAFHYTTFYQQEQGHVLPLGFGFPAGNYGVHLFFMISGFVIFMTLERTRTAMDFVVSRFSRLFPAYWAAMAITMVVVFTLGMPKQRIGIADLAANLTMLQGFLGFDNLDGSYWTLQVELFFYVQMLVWWVSGQLKRIHWIIAAWLLVAVVYAETTQHQLHFSYIVREMLIVRHIPFFAIGILFYRICTRPQELWLNLALMALSLIAISVSLAPVFLVAGLVCCTIFALFITGQLRWLRARAFVFLGQISYSLYLLHQAIGYALIHRLEANAVPSLVAVIFAACVSLILATILAYGVERPVMRILRDAWRRCRLPQPGFDEEAAPLR
jgi:peptidoglycan/LPS O-acetylase OafA/YrhL